MQVWDQTGFGGRADFINGPRRYRTLGNLPGGRVWTNRIRSLRLGRTAIVTAWSDENFRGPSLRFGGDTGPTQVRETGAASIESVEITCR